MLHLFFLNAEYITRKFFFGRSDLIDTKKRNNNLIAGTIIKQMHGNTTTILNNKPEVAFYVTSAIFKYIRKQL